MVEKRSEPEVPKFIATLGDLADVDRTVESLKMEVSFHYKYSTTLTCITGILVESFANSSVLTVLFFVSIVFVASSISRLCRC